ncbi:MAG: hypothetical protein PHC61_00155, partial [Chitinivibrionales bacterium]|nr:hypothetical protein [Chitinivibrionales bacterium]
MKLIINGIIFTCLGFLILSCSSPTKNNLYQTPERVVITGKVINVNKEIPAVKLDINRVGFGQETVVADVDSLGNFAASKDR